MIFFISQWSGTPLVAIITCAAFAACALCLRSPDCNACAQNVHLGYAGAVAKLDGWGTMIHIDCWRPKPQNCMWWDLDIGKALRSMHINWATHIANIDLVFLSAICGRSSRILLFPLGSGFLILDKLNGMTNSALNFRKPIITMRSNVGAICVAAKSWIRFFRFFGMQMRSFQFSNYYLSVLLALLG